jgi:hypothetical protein
MKNKFDKQGFKKFLQLYNRWLCSVFQEFSTEKMPEELYEGVLDEVLYDVDLDFLYNLYQEIEFNKQILNKKRINKMKI